MDVKNTNTGDGNTGNRNTGNWNTGSGNTGNRNTGSGNTGNMNTGYWNTGDGNTGYWNTGNRNTGNRNTGNGNTGNRNTGYLNTMNQTKGLLFNKECELWDKEGEPIIEFPNFFYFDVDTTEWIGTIDMTEEEKRYNKDGKTLGGYLKVYGTDKTLHTYWKQSFESATKEDVAKALKLPNFDYKIFEEITGITKEDFDRKLGVREEVIINKEKTIIIDGVEYILTPKNPL